MLARPSRLLLWLAPVVVGGGCHFSLERGAELAPGQVEGKLVREDQERTPAAFSRLSVPGSARVARALSDGTFHIAGLPSGRFSMRFDDDADGDGWPERGGFAGVNLPVNPSGDVGFVLLGDVGLNGAMTVRGEVKLDDGGDGLAPVQQNLVARVFVTRGQCFAGETTPSASPCDDTAVNRLELGAEAVTAVDSEGAFQFEGVMAGRVELAVVLTEVNGDGLGTIVGVQGPFVVDGDAGNDVTATPVWIPGFLPPAGDVPIVIAVNPPAPGGDVWLSVAGTAPPPCGADPADHPDARILADVLNGGAEVQLEVPVGVWDVTVCGDDDLVGTAPGVVALGLADEAAPPRYEVLRFSGDPCVRQVGGKEIVDCDGDNQQALPPLGDDTEAVWQDCVSQCWDGDPTTLGEASGALVCKSDGLGDEAVYDCDDDADGQPDTTEPEACRGPHRGTDLDGDGVCSPVDPSPQCQANDAFACPAGVEDVAPRNQVAGPASRDEGGRWEPGPTLPDGAVASPFIVPWVEPIGDREETVGFIIVGARDAEGVPRQDGLGLRFDDAGAGFSSFPLELSGEPTFPGEGLAFAPDGSSGGIALGGTSAGGVVLGGMSVSVFSEQAGAEPFLSATTFPLELATALGTLTFGTVNLTDQYVLVGGVGSDGAFVADVHFFEDTSLVNGSPPVTLQLAAARARHRTVLAPDEQRLVIIGGENGNGPLATVEVFDVSGTPFPLEAGARMTSARVGHTATLMEGGIVVVGGEGEASVTAEMLLFADGAVVTSPLPGPHLARHSHAATPLPDGRLLITGGFRADGQAEPTAEVYDPVSNTWTLLAPENNPRGGHEAVLLPSGAVAVMGGRDAVDGAALSTSEVFILYEGNGSANPVPAPGEGGTDGEPGDSLAPHPVPQLVVEIPSLQLDASYAVDPRTGRIAYRQAGSDLRLFDSRDGSSLALVDDGSSFALTSGAVTFDGQFLLALTASGVDPIDAGGTGQNVFLFNAETQTFSDVSVGGTTRNDWGGIDGVLAPDGSRILYTVTLDNGSAPNPGFYRTLDLPSGSAPGTVVDGVSVSGGLFPPLLSPDGGIVVFSTTDAYDDADANGGPDLYAWRLFDGAVTWLTPGGYEAQNNFAIGGSASQPLVSYLAPRNGGTSLVMVCGELFNGAPSTCEAVDGVSVLCETQCAGEVSLSPDGRWLAVSTELSLFDAPSGGVFRVDLQGIESPVFMSDTPPDFVGSPPTIIGRHPRVFDDSTVYFIDQPDPSSRRGIWRNGLPQGAGEGGVSP